MTNVEKTSHFEVAPPGHSIAYKNIDNLRIHQRLFNVEISFASNSFIIKDNFIKVYIIRKLVKFTI